MPSLVTAETEKYVQTWGVPHYGDVAPGERYVQTFAEYVRRTRKPFDSFSAVLDAGAGSGKGALALAREGFAVTLCDLTDAGLVPEAAGLPFVRACLWSDVDRLGGTDQYDYVYCCDVLEHIPPQFTMLVVANLLRVAEYGVFLSISLVPDVFGAWVGEPLHRTVQSFTWWRDSLAELGHVAEARDLLTSAIFIVEPRC